MVEGEEMELGGELVYCGMGTDETARPSGPDSVTRCVAVVKGSVVRLCQLGLGVAAVRLLALVSWGFSCPNVGCGAVRVRQDCGWAHLPGFTFSCVDHVARRNDGYGRGAAVSGQRVVAQRE